MIESVSDSAGAAPDLKKMRRRKAASTDLNRADRLPPHSLEAEQGVLGCVLLSPNNSLGQCIERLISGPTVFYDLRHQTIYAALVEMYDARAPVDTITLQQRLKDKQLLEEIGGIPYLNSLQDSVPSAANLSYYLDIVQEKALLRRMIYTCTDAVGRAYDYDGEVDALLDEVERDVLRIRTTIQEMDKVADIDAIISELEDDYSEGSISKQIQGILTGFPDMDQMMGGMMGQELFLIGGVPSSGKTTLALNIACNAASAGTIVSIHSGETSAKKIVHRILSRMGQVEGGKFFRGIDTPDDVSKMANGMALTRKISSRLLIHDNRALTKSRLLPNVRKDYQAGARLFVVDYLQLIEADGKTDTEKATCASKMMKYMAQELKCPVIVVSSLSRHEMGKPRRPTMRDLRQSGQIEYDADKILLLYCKEPLESVRYVEGIVEKNKDNPIGLVYFNMFPGQFRMAQARRIEENGESRPTDPEVPDEPQESQQDMM